MGRKQLLFLAASPLVLALRARISLLRRSCAQLDKAAMLRRLHIDQNLSWECHIQSICKKIASALGAIKRIHLIPFNVLINVYDSLIQPHFDYCNVVWSNCGIGLSDKLQRLILIVMRTICTWHWVGVSLNTKDKYRRLL